MAQEHNDYKNFDELAENLKGLGLSRLGVTAQSLKRFRKQQRKRYDKTAQLLEEMNRKLLKQTPSNHIFLCNRAGEYVSVYDEPESRILAQPLDLEAVKKMPVESLDAGANVNQRLYRLVKSGELAVREDLTMTGGQAIPTCAHLVWLDKKRKQAYFVGKAGQTELLEKALFPFINLMRRTRRTQALPADFGVADSVKQLDKLRVQLDEQFTKLIATDAKQEPKKAHKPRTDGDQEEKKKVAEAKKKLKKMSKKHKKEQLKQKRKLNDAENVPLGEETKKQQVDQPEEPVETMTFPKRSQPPIRLIINTVPTYNSTSSSSSSSSPVRSTDSDSMTTEVPRSSEIEIDLAYFSTPMVTPV